MLYGVFTVLLKFTTPRVLYLDFSVVQKVYLHRKLLRLQMTFFQPTKIKVVMICWDGQKIKLEQPSKLMLP